MKSPRKNTPVNLTLNMGNPHLINPKALNICSDLKLNSHPVGKKTLFDQLISKLFELFFSIAI